MASRRGNDVAGGGLLARIKDFSSLKVSTGFRKPGSQNPRKGDVARGRRRREEIIMIRNGVA